MVKFISRVGGSTSRYLVLAALTTALTACGGGSGDDPLGDEDFDEDGVINSEDDDADGDGIDDLMDTFVDLNGDGLDDTRGITELEAADFDEDGIINIDDEDADGDGIDDLEDSFVDLDNDGLDDNTMASEFTEVTDATPCGSESGTDNDSSTPNWNDNCTVRRSTVGGQFADSLYAVGVQRVVYCSGFGSGDTYANFADGEFGPGTEAALKAFQLSDPDPITDDGQVGPNTWDKLQSRIEKLGDGTFAENPDGTTSASDSYGFAAGRCAGIPLFYQTVTPGDDGVSVVEGGWTLARNQPNQTVQIPFSVDSPFNRL